MEGKNFLYNIRLTFKKPNDIGGFKEHSSFFEQCVKQFNEICSTSERNRKEITILEIGDTYAKIDLYSEVELEKPGRSIGTLTRLLIDENTENYDGFFSDKLFHKKLFLVEVLNNNEGLTSNEVSNLQLVNAINEVLLSPHTMNEEKRQAIQEMKEIAIKYNLIK